MEPRPTAPLRFERDMSIFYFVGPATVLFIVLLERHRHPVEIEPLHFLLFALGTTAWCLFVRFAGKNSSVALDESEITSNNGYGGRATLLFSEITRIERHRGKIGGLYLYNGKGGRIILSDSLIGFARLEEIIAKRRSDLTIGLPGGESAGPGP